MKIKLVFHDWLNKNLHSVYSTEKGGELSYGDFHSGTMFDGEITLDKGNTFDLEDALKKGYYPAFYIVKE
jgi:hypothetical protein